MNYSTECEQQLGKMADSYLILESPIETFVLIAQSSITFRCFIFFDGRKQKLENNPGFLCFTPKAIEKKKNSIKPPGGLFN